MKKYFNIFKHACRVEFRRNFYVVFLIFCFLFLVLVSKQSSKKASQTVMGTTLQSEEKYHLACPFSKDIYLPEDNTQLIVKKIKAEAIIIPHHLLAKDLINEALNKTTNDYNNIIIIGPNHFNLGAKPIQTTLLDWKTRFDWLKTDKILVTSLALNNLAEINEENFNSEHSICGLVSFLKIHFPESKATSIILKTNTSEEQAESLGQFLGKNCKDCLLIASIDFSHDVPQYQAEINDSKSIEILEKLDEEKINEITCDSLPALQTLFSYLKEKGVNKGSLITNSNSFNISHHNPSSVTSYITLIF